MEWWNNGKKKDHPVTGLIHPPPQEATVSRPWRNADVLRGLGEGDWSFGVTPRRRYTGSCPCGRPLMGQ